MVHCEALSQSDAPPDLCSLDTTNSLKTRKPCCVFLCIVPQRSRRRGTQMPCSTTKKPSREALLLSTLKHTRCTATSRPATPSLALTQRASRLLTSEHRCNPGREMFCFPRDWCGSHTPCVCFLALGAVQVHARIASLDGHCAFMSCAAWQVFASVQDSPVTVVHTMHFHSTDQECYLQMHNSSCINLEHHNVMI